MEAMYSLKNYLSQIFLVEKKDRGQRPVINLKGLNQFVKTELFKMKGLCVLPDLLQSQNWMVKMDLKDAYLQVPIHPDHQHLLSFQWKGREGIQVPMPSLWPIISAHSVHKATETSSGLPETEWLSADYILGRPSNDALS